MKKAVLTGIRRMEIVHAETPRIIRDTEVLIKMAVVGVCGSDIHYYVDGKIGSQVVTYPFAVGHEGAGVIEAVGAKVTSVKPGDRVAIEPAMPCFACDQCRAGRPHTCRKLRFLGCPGQAEGCLAEYIVMPETSCIRLKDSMSFEEAAISEPLAIGVYSVRQSIPMKNAAIGILGSGPIGLSVLLPALAQGARRIYVADKIDSRCALAARMGAYWTGNPAKQDIAAAINAAEPGQLDAVFECCGQQEALDQALEILKPGGKLMIVGIPREARVSFSIDTMRHKEICVQNVRRQNHCVQLALDMIDNRAFNVMPMVTHRFPFDKAGDAFNLVADLKDGVVKAMIQFDGMQ